MNKHDDENYLLRCLAQIEAKLNRGGRDEWSSYDFDQLIEEIQAATGVRLSLTTLKRVTGRIKYESFPTHTTLNALARYVGFKDWRSFVQQEQQSMLRAVPSSHLQTSDTASPDIIDAAHIKQGGSFAPLNANGKPHYRYRRAFLLLAILPLLFGMYMLIASRKKGQNPSLFSFRADKVFSVGVPNSVVFHYDATRAHMDSLFIVQTWDITRKALVDPEKHEHSAIYYYPGFFRTKLIADGEVVKTHDLQIASDGWVCLAEQAPRPLYFSHDEVHYGDSITVGAHTLQKYNLPLHPEAPRLRFYNHRDMGSLMNDNFTFEVQLKNPFNEGSNPCQFVQVLVQSKDDVMIIPLSAKACIGDLGLYAYGFEIDSKHGDLSGFGCNLSDWVTLRVQTVNKHMKLLVNGKAAYELDFPNEPTGIVGVQLRFQGPASVRGTRFESPDSVYTMQPSYIVSPAQ